MIVDVKDPQLHLPYIHPAHYDQGGIDETHHTLNFEFCRALNMTSLSIVLEKAVREGRMEPRVAELLYLQAGALLAQILSVNNQNRRPR